MDSEDVLFASVVLELRTLCLVASRRQHIIQTVALGMNAWHHTTSIHHSTVYENIIMRHLGAIFRVPLAAACTYFIYTSKAKAPKVE
mmetsp:Transcript_144089/g.276452  ORF Transcript_144089/g.276452 Transcript_144089/m.276452 type:complete len:87 (+) Transcript_144089:112-372(+)